MAAIASILGGVSGVLAFLVAILFFDVSWAMAGAAYFLTACLIFSSVLVAAALQGTKEPSAPVSEEPEHGLAIRS